MTRKKRLVFVLLWAQGWFVLSRNFQLQRVGDITWLFNNYNFGEASKYIDELIMLNVGGGADFKIFLTEAEKVGSQCFIPFTIGGGIRELSSIRECFLFGADKVVLNTALKTLPDLVKHAADIYGRQALVGSIDIGIARNGGYYLMLEGKKSYIPFSELIEYTIQASSAVGELIVCSVNRDGTGMGLDWDLWNQIVSPEKIVCPVIFLGGVGNSAHISEGLLREDIDAVATANLFNFIGDGLQLARYEVAKDGIPIPKFLPYDAI